MFKKSILTNSLLLAMVAPSVVMAEVEATIELRNETAIYTQSGQTTGLATSQLDNATNHSAGDLLKFQNQAKIFLNGDIGEESSWHAEIQIIYDSEAIDGSAGGGVDYQGHEDYTQNDYFRELYVDTEAAGWTLRLGKQQVVWGTADGIKLLDIINPTDFREVNQNVMEDARIPIWMINAERELGDSGNLQVVVSQAEKNKIPGINAGGDAGHPFMMKGAEVISGQVNGFYNIAPELGKVSNSFHNFASMGSFTGGNFNSGGLTAFTGLTVDGFAAQRWNVAFGNGGLPLLSAIGAGTPASSNVASASNPLLGGPGAYDGNPLLNTFANDTNSVGPNSNAYVTNLTNVQAVNGAADTVTWNPANPTAAFEWMSNTTFATFNTFAGTQTQPWAPGGIPSMVTQWVTEDKNDEANAGFRFKTSTDSGINFSVNYFYHYDANPHINLSYHDAVTGEKLTTVLAQAGDFANNLTFAPGQDGFPDLADPDNFSGVGGTITRAQVPSNFNGNSPISVLLRNGAGQYYGAVAPNAGLTSAGNGVALRFTETQNRVHSIGGAFDMAVDSLDVPLVLRGEFLYDQDVMQPVVDKRLLAIGDLEGALTSQETDFFKYVIGADVTVMTNLLISTQFIQFVNLDYVDTARTCTTQFGSSFDCSTYTADPATMSMNNGLQKGWETKEFLSVFLSKPIGEDQLGRWNNMTIWEEGNGWWNRLDAEYSVSDQFIVSAEWNHYWGDDNTTFGQLDKASNVQVGFKYIFEDY